jgi:hypothetical protein
MEWLIFLLGIAVLEIFFQAIVSTRVEKTLTNLKKLIPHSDHPKKIAHNRLQRFPRISRNRNTINLNQDSVPSQ